MYSELIICQNTKFALVHMDLFLFSFDLEILWGGGYITQCYFDLDANLEFFWDGGVTLPNVTPILISTVNFKEGYITQCQFDLIFLGGGVGIDHAMSL